VVSREDYAKSGEETLWSGDQSLRSLTETLQEGRSCYLIRSGKGNPFQGVRFHFSGTEHHQEAFIRGDLDWKTLCLRIGFRCSECRTSW
jgi:hypothetical protein